MQLSIANLTIYKFPYLLAFIAVACLSLLSCSDPTVSEPEATNRSNTLVKATSTPFPTPTPSSTIVTASTPTAAPKQTPILEAQDTGNVAELTESMDLVELQEIADSLDLVEFPDILARTDCATLADPIKRMACDLAQHMDIEDMTTDIGSDQEDVQLQPRSGFPPREASEINRNFDCNRPYYDSQPAPVSSDSAHRYYEYYWQSNPKVCINIYEPDLIDDYWEARISKLLTFAKDTIGLVLPVNVTVLDQRNSSPETLKQVNIDECSLRQAHYVDQEQLDECVNYSDPWGGRFNSAGVDSESLLNGGSIALFAGTWEVEIASEVAAQKDRATKIFLHEYFHIHQNALKFFFESTQTFGIPIAWQDDPNNNIHEEPPTQSWVFPNWIEEGGAEFAGIILAAKFDPLFDARSLFENTLDEARNVVVTAANNGDVVSLKDYEYQGGLYESSDNPNNGIAREYAYQYSGGAWALMYLWSLEENNLQKIMIDYYKQWAEKENANPGYAWKDSFESLFDIALDDFYKDFDAFMLQDKESQLAILKTSPEIQAAVLKP